MRKCSGILLNQNNLNNLIIEFIIPEICHNILVQAQKHIDICHLNRNINQVGRSFNLTIGQLQQFDHTVTLAINNLQEGMGAFLKE